MITRKTKFAATLAIAILLKPAVIVKAEPCLETELTELSQDYYKKVQQYQKGNR